MVSCEVITKIQHTPIIGTYLPPSTLENLPDLEEALTCFRYRYPIVIGDLISDIGKPQNSCIQQFTDLLTDFGLMDLVHHFLQG